MPAGSNQISHGTSVVKQHFATASVLFGLHQLVRGVLNVFNRVTISIASWLPIPGLDVLVKIIDRIINTSLANLDMVILAQILRRQTDNPWAIARDSTVLYAQNYKGVLKNAVFLTFTVWTLTLLLWIAVGAPIAAAVHFFHMQTGIWTLVLALIAALSIKAALIDPFATVALPSALNAAAVTRPRCASGCRNHARRTNARAAAHGRSAGPGAGEADARGVPRGPGTAERGQRGGVRDRGSQGSAAPRCARVREDVARSPSQRATNPTRRSSS